MRLQKIILATVVCLPLIIAGCEQQNNQVDRKTITIEHAQGTTDVPLNPKKVIVLNPAALDTMDALNIHIDGVPQTNAYLPQFLAKYKNAPYINVGTLFEPDYEAISNFAPDLIIAGGRANDAYNKLSAIAPTISLEIDNQDFMPSLATRVTQLGEIFEKQDVAQTQLTQFKQKVEQLKAQTKDLGNALVIMISGGKISAYGPGSRFGFIYDELGFTPATRFPEGGRHGNVINAELLLSINPDWLFVLDRDSAIGNNNATSAKQVLDNTLIHKTKAWNNDHIVYLDSSALYIAGGLQTYSQLIEQINSVLANKQP